MKWLIGIFFLFLLLTSPHFYQANTIDTGNGKDKISLGFIPDYLITKKKPTICVHEPQDKNVAYDFDELYKISKKSAEQWVSVLEEKSGVKGVWNIEVVKKSSLGGGEFLKTGHFLDCDINIIWKASPNLNPVDGSYIAAYAQHFQNFRLWHDIIIYTWSYQRIDFIPINGTDVPNFLVFETPKDNLEYTLVHEIGHTLGLEHALINGKEFRWYGYDEDHAKSSVMYLGAGIVKEKDRGIRELDWTALIYKFGTDGWSGWSNNELDSLTRDFNSK